MNYKNYQDRLIKDPLFKFDPDTGKKILLPIKWTSPSSTNVKSSEKRAKRTLTIAPLNLTPADFEEPNRASKIRKKDVNSVRKELFNLPAKDSQMSRPSYTRRTISRRSITSQKAQKKIKPCELSPLLDMEEVEEELMKKKRFIQGYPFKTPSKPVTKFSLNSKSSSFKGHRKLDEKNIPKIVISHTTESPHSNESFLKLEKICTVGDPGTNDEYEKSPISSVCNLLNETNINSSKKNKNKVFSDFTNIQQHINDMENILIESSTVFENYKISHQQNISKITELLENDRKDYENFVMLQNRNKNTMYNILKELKYAIQDPASRKDANEENKENTPVHHRRSRRLLNKSPIQTQGAKLIVSPAILKSKDLRKTTLTKNLVNKSQQYNIESPRIQKAIDMYNSMRCEVSFLATPKFDKNCLRESPRSSNLLRSFSRRVQNQCLLLQDTPIHK